MEQKSTIFLADDHLVLRTGLKQLIEKLGPFKVISEFDNGEDLLLALKKGNLPDLLVLDLQMPVKGGLEVMEELFQQKIALPVLVLTMDAEEKTIVRLFKLGVRGYLRKDCTADTMRKAIQDILSIGFYHNEFLTMSLQSTDPFIHLSSENITELLNEREKEFLLLVCHENELTYEQIARKMFLQVRTVDGYRASIFQKFGVKSKTGLVLFVIKHKLLDRLQAK